jgi:hypothetical protein
MTYVPEQLTSQDKEDETETRSLELKIIELLYSSNKRRGGLLLRGLDRWQMRICPAHPMIKKVQVADHTFFSEQKKAWARFIKF